MSKRFLHIYKTPTAEHKIKEIIKFSTQKWGKETAKKYALELEKTIKLVAEGKIRTRKNNVFSTEFSYYLTKRHYIFFKIQDDKLIVVTLFHVSMNIKKRLIEEVI